MRILIYLSYGFFISEFILMLLKRSKKTSTVKRKDKGSLLILWVSIPVCITAGFYAANISKCVWISSGEIIFYSGLFVFLIGFILRWSAIFQLKKAFTVDVAINQNHILKTDGLYKKIRHPSYSGLFLILAGLSFAMNNIFSFLLITIIIFTAINYRIYIEEKILTEEFGGIYENYKSKTKKLIPGIF